VKISILDLAPIRRGETATESFAASVALAQAAERLGYSRVWYAEHHNMPTIASSATSVLIAHVAAHTSTIRLGAGGIMLPNHAPLMIAEQFGTLEAMYPGRIDLGLGRAPGTDRVTMRALRRGLGSVDHFPQDVLELQGYLGDESELAGVDATPGKGTPMCRSTSWAPHCSAPSLLPHSVCRTRSRRISRPLRSNRRGLSTEATSSRPRSSASRT
jgi:luciferase family oxidoreductase group 1